METVEFQLPTIEQVNFSMEVEPDEIPVRGNAIVSGDDNYDKEVEDELIERLNAGDVWAWALVTVTAEWNGVEGYDTLGGCSYKCEDDFKGDLYYEDLKQRAYDELITNLKALSRQ